MIGYKNFKDLAKNVLKTSEADQTEIVFTGSDRLLTRFSKNEIHQNMLASNTQASIRVVKGKKIGSASTNKVDKEGLLEALKKAGETADLQREDENFRSLPIEKNYLKENEIRLINPDDIAEKVGIITKIAADKNMESFGSFQRENNETAVFNSLGTASYFNNGCDNLRLVVMKNDLSGFSANSSYNITDQDMELAANNACYKCLYDKTPARLNPGKYTVYLEENAVIDMLEMLNYIGFSGLRFIEGRSFLSENIGKKVTGKNISIFDDGKSKHGIPTFFDYEGVKKQKVKLIENGIAIGAVYDSYTAGLCDAENTGHSLPQPNQFGPYALNLFMKGGNSKKEDMIASIDKGIYVTRFHYTNVVHPIQTIITGMTRDGTFLIENGEIARPIKNMRFTQSILEAFANAVKLSKSRKLLAGEGDSYLAPAAVINDFNFTGVSEL